MKLWNVTIIEATGNAAAALETHLTAMTASGWTFEQALPNGLNRFTVIMSRPQQPPLDALNQRTLNEL